MCGSARIGKSPGTTENHRRSLTSLRGWEEAPGENKDGLQAGPAGCLPNVHALALVFIQPVLHLGIPIFLDLFPLHFFPFIYL